MGGYVLFPAIAWLEASGWSRLRITMFGRILPVKYGHFTRTGSETGSKKAERMTKLVHGPEAPRQRLDLMTRADPGKAIRRAQRHSLLVRHIRLAIVVISGFAIISVAIVAIFDPLKRLPGNISVGQVGLKGSLVTMAAPKMAGMRPNGEPFELHSLSGVQDILKPDIVKLFGVNAKIVMDDSSTSRITAASGVYDSSKDMIWLKGDVHIINDSGYSMHMPSAAVNIKSSALVTKEPVVVLLNGGRIAAASMDIEDNGHKISFDGNVKSVVDSRLTVDGDDSGAPDMEAESTK